MQLADLPAQHYGCILADPPWAFRTHVGDAVPARGAQPYATMTLDSLKALPVERVAARDCLLHMWIIDSHLPQAIDLAETWGFEYKTRGLTWRKLTNDGTRTRMGMGYWLRGESERALIFTRGHPQRLDAGVREIIDAPIREHSRKPDEQYERLERLVGGPYLELFSRTDREGWTAWGNETGRFQ